MSSCALRIHKINSRLQKGWPAIELSLCSRVYASNPATFVAISSYSSLSSSSWSKLPRFQRISRELLPTSSLFSTATIGDGDLAPKTACNNSNVANKASDLSLLEIRVGKIVEIGRHPEADSLYVEKVDVGEPNGPRIIVSGLVAFCKEEELLNRNVIVLCNLKPRALKGVTSYGMLLCASNSDHTAVVPITPPPQVPVGQLVTFEGHPSAYVEPGNKATKAFSKIAEELYVDEHGVATFKGNPFMTPQGPVTSTLKGKIS